MQEGSTIANHGRVDKPCDLTDTSTNLVRFARDLSAQTEKALRHVPWIAC